MFLLLEPLVGLASNQVNLFSVPEHNMEAYHREELKQQDRQLLIDRLSSYNTDGEEAQHVGISLFIGPKLINSRVWQTLLERMAKEGNMRLIVIDEAHFVSQSGRNFRPEFKLAVRFLERLLEMMPRRVPRILLSATMLKSDVEECTTLLGGMEPNVLHGHSNFGHTRECNKVAQKRP